MCSKKWLICFVVLTGCVSGDRLARYQAPAPAFDPIRFFAGRTQGSGSLKIAFHRAESTLVEGTGRIQADGAIILDQTVRRGDRPATQRRWHLRPDGQGRFVGTLSDANGPVTGIVDGNRLHLTFAMKGGLKAEQWLYLTPDRAAAHNVMIVTKIGIPVARLDETIKRLGMSAR